MEAAELDPGGLSVHAGTTRMTTGSAQLGWMRESSPQLAVAELQRRLDSDGYLLLRALIAPRTVELGTFLAQKSARVGSDGLGLTGDDFFSSAEGRAVIEAAELRCFFTRLWGRRACCTGPQVLRPVPPGVATGFHMDNVYMARGSRQLHTVWIPFVRIPLSLGGLVILEGSNRLQGFARMRDTYGLHDVDKTTIRQSGHISNSAAELLSYAPGARWVTAAEFCPGDVVVLGMQTLHGSLRNQTANSVRLSCDVRYQPCDDAFDERWVRAPDGGPARGHGRFESDGTWFAGHGPEQPGGGISSKDKTVALETAKRQWWGLLPPTDRSQPRM